MPILARLRFRTLITLCMWIISARDWIVIRFQGQTLQQDHPSGIAHALMLASGPRVLESSFEQPALPPKAAILLLHGIGDRLAYWPQAQRLLAEHTIASLIIHYSGYGRSTGAITLKNLTEDIHAAYAHLRTMVPNHTPLFVLGFSMGTAALAEVVNHLAPHPDGIILCQPFPSLRAAAAQIASSRLLARLVPDCWPTATTLRTLPCPLLLVHTDADPLFPLSMAREIEAAAAHSLQPVTLAIPAGHGHNDVYLRPREGYWEPILEFIHLHSLADQKEPEEPVRS